jgi:peptide-methionine (S)-S-oxide reductase
MLSSLVASCKDRRYSRFRRSLGQATFTVSTEHLSTGVLMDERQSNTTETATLAGGCFWCLEAVFDELTGVSSVKSGYAGGHTKDPTYRQVCSGTTGHAEVVQVVFDPNVVSFEDILRVFFTIHDPTTLNRQGADVGTQYRSAIFYHSPAQKATAESVIRELEDKGVWKDRIVTELAPFDVLYPAEDYHDEYFRRNQNQPYCQVVIEPKVAKFRKQYLDRLKSA